MGFDVTDALLMTVGGVGMAFLVLILLTVLTAVMGRVARWSPLATSRPRPVAPETEVPEPEDLEMAAIIAVSVVSARLSQRRPITGGRSPMATSTAANNWSAQGRRDIMASRSGRRPS